MNIRFEQHIGTQQTPYGELDIDLKQDWILLNGVACGLVGNVPGSPLCIFADLPKSILPALKEEVDRQRGNVSSKLVAPLSNEVLKAFNETHVEDDEE